MRYSFVKIYKLLYVIFIVAILVSISSCSTGSNEITLTAEDGEFSRNTIGVPAGSDVSIIFENRDSVRHNFAVYRSDKAEEEIFIGEIIESGESITYTFTAPDYPGTYFFRCDLHPETMTGVFSVYGTGS